MEDLQTAMQLHRQGQFQEAERIYRALLADNADFAEALHGLAILRAMQQDYTEAKDLAQQALKLEPQNAAFLNTLGNIQMGQHHYDAAAQTFQKILQQYPDYAPAHNNLGKCAYQREDWQQAKAHFSAAAKAQPQNSDAFFNLGLVEIKLNQRSEAKTQLQKAIELNPQHSAAHYQLAQLYIESDNTEQATTHLEQTLALTPNNGNALHDLGVIFLRQEDFKQAISKLSAAVDNDCTDPFAHYHLALAYLSNNDYKNALQHFLRQTQVNKDYSSYYNAAVILMHQERHQDALMYFTIALKQRPETLALHINLGSLYLKLQKLPEAIKHYQKAFELDPDNKEIAHILMAIEQKQTPDAAPAEYLQHLFDQYAVYFDEHLTKHLDYQVPNALRDAIVIETVADTQSHWRCLDLGCGTGLMGQLIKPYCDTLIGIDISEHMLAEAKKKAVYDELKHQDISHFLKQDQAPYDIIIAADVFTYIGNLKTIFELCHERLKQQAWFAFTVERSTSPGFKLQTNIRYAHHKDYITDLATHTGFTIKRCDNLVLRKQHKQNVEGYLFILQR